MSTDDKIIHLHLTGFGPFLDVKENPSSTIAKLVADYYSSKASPSSKVQVKIASLDELEVSVQAVQKYVDNQAEQQQKNKSKENVSNKTVHFYLHFGINRSAKKTIAIENEAVNCVMIPPNDHSQFPDFYFTDICQEYRCGQKKEQQQQTPESSSSSSTEQQNQPQIINFSADTTGDAASSSTVKPPPPTTTKTTISSALSSDIVSTLFPSRVRELTKEICSTILSRPFKNNMDTSKRTIVNKTDEEEDDTPPEDFVIAQSFDAGKYLCNFIFYLSLLKLSSRKMKTVAEKTVNIPNAYFSELWRKLPAFMSTFGGKNNTKSDDEKEEEEEEEESHSLFIHVLDPSRVLEKEQTSAICQYLDILFEKL